jgi:putative oxidoreductase
VENGGEKPALFAFAFLLIAFFGSGVWALEKLPVFKQQEARQLAAATE